METTRLRRTLRHMHQRGKIEFNPETREESAIRSYIEGGPMSRSMAWGKLRCILAAADLAPGATVFDFGCGTGILLPELAAAGRTVYATDLDLASARMLVEEMHIPNVTFLESAEWPDLAPGGGVDAVIAANVLEHVEDRRSLLRDLAGKLKPGGRIVISGPTENRLYRLGRRLVGFSGDYHVTNVFDVFADAEAVGLRRISMRSFPFIGPFCLYKIAAFAPPSEE